MSRFAQAPVQRAPDTYICLQGKIMGETEKAVRFLVMQTPVGDIPKEAQKGIWLPLSQIKSMTKAAPDSGDPDVVNCKEWIWKAKINDTWGGRDPSITGVPLNIDDLNDIDEDLGDYSDYDDPNLPPF